MRELIESVCKAKGWTLSGNRINVPLGEGRHQEVRFNSHEAKGLSFLRLYSLLGEADALDERRMRAALRLNWTMPYGGLAIAAEDKEDEKLLIVDAMIPDPNNPERLGIAIEYMAHTADEYERHVFGTDKY